MKKILAPAFLGTALAACSVGETVVVPPPNDTAASALACSFAPGDDVCGLDFGVEDPAKAREAAEILQGISDFAALAHAALEAAHDACAEILLSQGQTIDGSGAKDERTKRLCDSVGREIATEIKLAHVEYSVGCEEVRTPRCEGTKARPRLACGSPVVKFELPASLSPSDRSLLPVLERRLPAVLRFLSLLEWEVELSGALAANIDLLSEVAACVPAAATMASTAISETKMALEASLTITDALKR